VKLQVDAPHGAFSGGGEAYVAVGIDSNRDGRLSEENIQPQRFFADRQVNVAATSFAPNGTLTLDNRIGDFSLNLTGNASTTPVWVLGQLRLQQLQPVGDSVEIKLDGAPPEIERIRLPGREIEAGKDLEVTINVNDLSRVVKVEAAFETSTTGNTEENAASWTPAAPTDDYGKQWFTKLPTKDLHPGTRHFVTVRATDEVGHVATKTMEAAVQVASNQVDAGQAREPVMQNKTADINGVVLFKRSGLQATVEFDPPLVPPIAPVESNEAGRFSFTNVPPGKHKLHARGQKNGYYRNAWMEVEVPAGGSETPITVTLNAE
jgi:hypothetical protein